MRACPGLRVYRGALCMLSELLCAFRLYVYVFRSLVCEKEALDMYVNVYIDAGTSTSGA